MFLKKRNAIIIQGNGILFIYNYRVPTTAAVNRDVSVGYREQEISKNYPTKAGNSRILSTRKHCVQCTRRIVGLYFIILGKFKRPAIDARNGI